LEIAAAGNHASLLMGCHGSGKSLLAHRATTILPARTKPEADGTGEEPGFIHLTDSAADDRVLSVFSDIARG
jgi:hypothetical protein